MKRSDKFILAWQGIAAVAVLPVLVAVPASLAFSFTVAGASPAGNGAASQPSANFVEPASSSGAPVVSKVEPASAGPGSNFILTVKGRNFVQGARIAFSNPKITVIGTNVKSKSELTAHVQIASDAASGSTGLFVVNPDQNEVEGSFEVSGGAINTAPSAPAASTATPAAKNSASSAGGKAVSFDVFNVGDVVQVLKTKSQVHGTLSVDKGMLSYVENGAEVFSVPVNEVQEVASNVFFGLNTGTFHVFLSTGRRYNFTAASLNPADTQKIETQLQEALK
ncbi:MAG: IPT/TIG domain-containing protein [Terriglobia bacterium]